MISFLRLLSVLTCLAGYVGLVLCHWHEPAALLFYSLVMVGHAAQAALEREREET